MKKTPVGWEEVLFTSKAVSLQLEVIMIMISIALTSRWKITKNLVWLIMHTVLTKHSNKAVT